MNEELKNGLEALSVELKGKTEQEVKTAIDSFEAKFQDVVSKEVKEVKESFEAELKALKDHANKLDVKLQEKAKSEVKGDFISKALADNFEEIKSVENGTRKQFKTEVKNMTLTSALTGDAPRDYNFNPVSAPSPLVNVSDLVGSRQISGGTYTYVRVTKASGNIQTQTEGSSKSQINYNYEMVDVNTDYLAGYARYSKKMRNNLPFLQSSLPVELRRDYIIAENTKFGAVLEAEATASAITEGNEIERLLNNISVLAQANFQANGIVINPLDYFKIITTEKSTGAGYGLPGVVTVEGGMLRVNGIGVYQATWVSEGQYYVGDWSRVNKIVTEGLSLAFSEEEGTNFVTNSITARIEEQNALAVEQPSALIYGNFTTEA